jgi:hypothetical protein
MKLTFKKDKDSQISVFQVIDKQEKEFSYVDMIKTLIETKVMEEPDISDGFTEAESKSIKSMVSFINKEISTQMSPDLEK